MTCHAVLGGILWVAACLQSQASEVGELKPVALQSKVESVQPMTGIVLWTSNPEASRTPIQLEFAYLRYDQVVDEHGEYDWRVVDRLLDEVAGRTHQAILRWHDTYVGRPTGVPKFIKAMPDYRETTALSEKKRTGFPDWSHPELQRFVLDFFTRFTERYDRDSRIAFVEVGFGLWAEYHIYDGPMELGRTFPSLDYQRRFAKHMDTVFQETPWMISVDAASDDAPFAGNPDLLGLGFGLFDDSFNNARHAEENEPNWRRVGRDRWKIAPMGGEFSFYEDKDQREALSPRGPHGVPFEDHARRFHITFMIGDNQPKYVSADRIREAGMACGYRFQVDRFESGSGRSVVAIQNTGIATIYYDAFPAVDGVRASESLKGLLPGDVREFEIKAGGAAPRLTIECDRLVPGQSISFDANLSGAP